MNEEKKSPINLLTDALANMTLVAMEAERERDAAKDRGDEWYKYYQEKDEKYKEMQTMLAAEIQAHNSTKVQLEEAIAAVNKLTDELMSLRPTYPAEADKAKIWRTEPQKTFGG